jgi:hypothetical protein
MVIDKEHEIEKLKMILGVPIDNVEHQDDFGGDTGVAIVYFDSRIIGVIRYHRYEFGCTSSFGYDPRVDNSKALNWGPIYDHYKKEIDEVTARYLAVPNSPKTQITPIGFKKLHYANRDLNLYGSCVCNFYEGIWSIAGNVQAK